MRVTHDGGGDGMAVGVANRGLGNEGLHLEAGKVYVGAVFALVSEPVELTVALRTIGSSTSGGSSAAPLASQVLHVAPPTSDGAKWTQLNFTLTPTAGATCQGIDSKSAWKEHAVGCPNGMAENHFTPNEYPGNPNGF